MFKCSICSKIFSNVIVLIRHLKIIHKFNSANNYKCAQANCSRTFQTIAKFKNHLIRKHTKNSSDCPTTNHPVNLPLFEYLEPDLCNAATLSINCTENTETTPDALSCDEMQEIVKNASTAFCAKLYTIKNLPRVHVQTIVEEVNEYITTGYLPLLQKKVISTLTELSCDQHIIDDIEQSFDILNSPFEGLTSEFLRMKNFQQNKFYVHPESYNIGTILINKVNENGVNQVQSNDVFGQYISVSNTLREFFQLPNVYDMIKKSATKSDCSASFDSILQGTVWKKKVSSFPTNKQDDIFPLLLYFDDFETGNPLGSHAGIHKTGVVYYSVPAIPMEYQSKLENLFVALIFNSNDRVQFGNKRTFQPLINELIKLETDGVVMETDNGSKTTYFVVLAIVGDNLGANSIMGFVESFSANHYCRICRCHKSEMSKQIFECPDALRTTENYNFDVLKGNVSETGVTSIPVWNDIPSFNNIDNCTVDIMHDVFEGVCRYDMALVINYLITQKLCSLDVLNSRLNHFDFKSVSNVPPQIKHEHLKKNCIIMSASEMMNLVQYFPLVVGDLVPEDDEVWTFFLILKELVEVILSDSVSVGFCQYVRNLVAEHHSLHLKLFSENLKPKHHFLVHYPRVMKMFGPLKQLWCMRFEGKHRELKSTALSISSRRNLPLSLAVRSQLNVSYRLISKTGLTKGSAFGPGELIETSTLSGYEQFRDVIPEKALSVSWADVNGIRYLISSTLLIEIQLDEQIPVFAKVEHILCDTNDTCIFVMSKYTTIGFNSHLRAYHLDFQNPSSFIVCPYGKLPSYKVLSTSKGCDGNTYVMFQ